MSTKTNQTAMQQLIQQLREERMKLPMPIECDRCYQALEYVEYVITHTYIPIEKQQIKDSWMDGLEKTELQELASEKYYKETYSK